jgi:hypothetical protein
MQLLISLTSHTHLASGGMAVHYANAVAANVRELKVIRSTLRIDAALQLDGVVTTHDGRCRVLPEREARECARSLSDYSRTFACPPTCHHR